MNYQLYLFDFDYTLANSEKGIVMCFRHVFLKNGFDGISDDTIKATIGLTLEQAFTGMTGIEDREKIAELRRQYVEKSDAVMTKNTWLYPEALGALLRLKAKGALLGIISTKFRSRIAQSLDEYGIGHLIDLVIGGEDVSRAKPDPEGLERAIGHFAIPRERVLYIGDSIVDAKTALNGGVDFMAVTTGATGADAFLAYPHVGVMENLGMLG